jgi:hypothetical protein
MEDARQLNADAADGLETGAIGGNLSKGYWFGVQASSAGKIKVFSKNGRRIPDPRAPAH